MARYRAKTRKELNGKAPVIIMTEGETLNSVGGFAEHGKNYVHLKGMTFRSGEKDIDVYIREDSLQRVP